LPSGPIWAKNKGFWAEDPIVYAVIASGGKQYRVAEGDVVRVEELGAEPGAEVEFKDVLLVKTADETRIGQPLVAGATVKGVVQDRGQGEKVLVFKYKKKKQYRRTRGHRQRYTDVRVEKINLAG
jgi:large subunit ribosomal protein L21